MTREVVIVIFVIGEVDVEMRRTLCRRGLDKQALIANIVLVVHIKSSRVVRENKRLWLEHRLSIQARMPEGRIPYR